MFNRLKRRLPVACRLALLNEGGQGIRSKVIIRYGKE